MHIFNFKKTAFIWILINYINWYKKLYFFNRNEINKNINAFIKKKLKLIIKDLLILVYLII